MMKHRDVKLPTLVVIGLLFIQNSMIHAQKGINSVDYNLTLQHATLVVSNFEVSRKFYIDTLLMEDMHADWLQDKQMSISLGNNLELHIGEVPGVEIRPSGFNHIAISTNNLDGYLERLKSLGITYGRLGMGKSFYVQTRPDGVRQTFLQDPDGYWIEINDAN